MKFFLCVVLLFLLSGCGNPAVIIEELSIKEEIVLMNNETLLKDNTNEIITLVDFEKKVVSVFENSEKYDGAEVQITGYFTKMLDDKMYYFIANDFCLGCDNEDTYGKFIEVKNKNDLNLDGIYSDDFVSLTGTIEFIEDNDGYSYPIVNLKTIEKKL